MYYSNAKEFISINSRILLVSIDISNGWKYQIKN